MAILKNPYDKNFRGTIDKLVVVRQYSGERTVLSSYPDMSGIKPTMAQQEHRMSFKKAQKYAKEFLSIPANKRFIKSDASPVSARATFLFQNCSKAQHPSLPLVRRRCKQPASAGNKNFKKWMPC